ncbi:MAG: tyrosine-type recombinase/integrase [Alphaproteobacteria bacterium]|nr:tyrosine-type recombinase/integrase [Alphaproteobacteria bacterium]MBQ6787014.1 tyrosine-type recombinase/integrase [Lachnospiraceae bacterium]
MEINEEMLKFLLKKANISSIDEVSNRYEFMTNKQILAEHPYAITTNKDGRFSTYVPDESKPSKRKKLVKPSQKELEQAIVKYYKEREKSKKKLCLKDLYPEWLEYKALHTDSSAYIKTIDELWRSFYINNKIITIPIEELDEVTLDTWACSMVKNHKMTKKKYYNMSIIIRQSLEYAVKKKIIADNPYEKVKIDKKLFRNQRKKPDETQVYLMDEQPLVEKQAFEDFKMTGCSASLAIPFAFQAGMRISELAALKWSDIGEEKENYIHVSRMEVREFDRLPNGSWSKERYVIVERTKSDAGNRNVYLTTSARSILEQAKESNRINGYADSEYIFLNKKGRATARALNTILRRCCNLVNISEKGMHAIRKNYISTLIDSNDISINYIREMVGHVDERTTYSNYCYNRKSQDQTALDMEKALVHNF